MVMPTVAAMIPCMTPPLDLVGVDPRAIENRRSVLQFLHDPRFPMTRKLGAGENVFRPIVENDAKRDHDLLLCAITA
jgi:hypothetical protein